MSYSAKIYSWFSIFTSCLSQFKWEQNVSVNIINLINVTDHLRTHKIRNYINKKLVSGSFNSMFLESNFWKKKRWILVVFTSATATVNDIELK